MYAIRSYYVNKTLVIDNRGKKYLLNKDLDNFGNDLGVVDLIGKEEGSILITNKGGEFYFVRITSYNVCYTKLLRNH